MVNGEWLQADTIIPPGVHPHSLGAGGLDRYAYVNNSPINYVDPSGHVACDDEEGICSGNPSKNKPSQGGLPSGNGGDGVGDEDDNLSEKGQGLNAPNQQDDFCYDHGYNNYGCRISVSRDEARQILKQLRIDQSITIGVWAAAGTIPGAVSGNILVEALLSLG